TSSSISGNTITGSVGSQVGVFDGSSGITIANNFIDNGQARGIRVEDFGGGPNSNVTINQNHIAGNVVAGLEVGSRAYTGTLDTTQNFWGSPTGPTTPNNPGGTGEKITDPNNHPTLPPYPTSSTHNQPDTPA